MATISIFIDCKEDEIEWLKNRVVPAIEEIVDDQIDEGRIEAGAQVNFEIEYDA